MTLKIGEKNVKKVFYDASELPEVSEFKLEF